MSSLIRVSRNWALDDLLDLLGTGLRAGRKDAPLPEQLDSEPFRRKREMLERRFESLIEGAARRIEERSHRAPSQQRMQPCIVRLCVPMAHWS